MAGPLLCCTDGSDAANDAVRVGIEVVGGPADAVLATVVSTSDPTLVTGTGMAGGTMSDADFEAYDDQKVAEGRRLVEDAAAQLGIARTVLLRGDPGRAICDHAGEIGAAAIVMGTRGRGGLRRAVLGSVSDHVVRNAPCPVVVCPPPDEG